MSWWKKLQDKARGVFGSAATERVQQGGCDHGDIRLRQGTAEFEWFVARGELEMKGDLAHGASHLANLLSYDPGYREWVKLLEQYLAAAGSDPEALIPRGDKLYYSTEAMRAYIWNKQGQYADAVGLLVQVVQAKPDARYLEAWVLPWLEPDGVLESLPEQLCLHLFSVILGRFPEAMTPALRLKQMRRWAKLSERFAKHAPGEGISGMLRAGLLRKAGYFDEAEKIARAVLDRAPDWHMTTALGLILREKGDCAEAEKAFRWALKLDPDDVSARLETGDMYFDRQDWQRALDWYDNALAKERGQPWADASARFCRWKLTGKEKSLNDLIDMAKGGNERAQGLCQRIYLGGLPEPADATANILRQFRQNILDDPGSAPSGAASITISCLEAPSTYLAFRLEMAALDHDLTVTVAVEQMQRPDPRQPIAPVKYVLWKYNGTDAVPGLPPPGEDVSKRIAALARAPFDEMANWAAASRAALTFGPARVGEILATMVHPPPVPEGLSTLTWLPRVQHAAAQVAAQVDEGWEGSVRQAALLSVLYGPYDWATQAAIRTLAQLGRENEAYAPDIHDTFQFLTDHRPQPGYCCWEHTLYENWMTLPHLYPQEREEMERRLREIEARGQEEEDAQE